jgi:pimeloyl-ACP methyl ester carboxylesterase
MPLVCSHGCRLHYEVIDLVAPWMGNPETVLFNHGLGASGGAWAEWLPFLIDRYRVVRFDLRGHAASKDGAQSTPLTFDMLCDDVIAVADAAGLADFHFVGESVGGTIGLTLATAAPGRFRSLTVSNAAHRGERIESIGHFEQLLRNKGTAGWSHDMMTKRFYRDTVTEELWAWYEGNQASVSPELLMSIVTALVSVDLTATLPDIEVPVLLLSGDSSPFIPVSSTAELSEALSDVELQILPHARHGVPVSHAKQCAQTLRSYLDRLSRRSGGQNGTAVKARAAEQSP